MSSAGFSNLISMYGEFMNDDASSIGYLEKGQGGMVDTPWKVRDRYIANSPFFFLDRVQNAGAPRSRRARPAGACGGDLYRAPAAGQDGRVRALRGGRTLAGDMGIRQPGRLLETDARLVRRAPASRRGSEIALDERHTAAKRPKGAEQTCGMNRGPTRRPTPLGGRRRFSSTIQKVLDWRLPARSDSGSPLVD